MLKHVSFILLLRNYVSFHFVKDQRQYCLSFCDINVYFSLYLDNYACNISLVTFS